MDKPYITLLIVAIVGIAIAYFLIRDAVYNGTLKALIEYDEFKNNKSRDGN